MEYTKQYTEKLIKEKRIIERERLELAEAGQALLEKLAETTQRRNDLYAALRDLVAAIKSSGAAEAVVSNDLGNALDAAEDALKGK